MGVDACETVRMCIAMLASALLYGMRKIPAGEFAYYDRNNTGTDRYHKRFGADGNGCYGDDHRAGDHHRNHSKRLIENRCKNKQDDDQNDNDDHYYRYHYGFDRYHTGCAGNAGRRDACNVGVLHGAE